MAPYLANLGYKVYVVDFPEKNNASHTVAKGLNYSQYELITEIMPDILKSIRCHANQPRIHIGAHSWGGVIVIAYLARFIDENVVSFFSFGSKRRIAQYNFKRFLYIEIGWYIIGNMSCWKRGYLSHKAPKMGNEDEPKDYYKQTTKWIYSKKWIDPIDAFDYKENLKKINTPPALFITGKGDTILGHPNDVRLLKNE